MTKAHVASFIHQRCMILQPEQAGQTDTARYRQVAGNIQERVLADSFKRPLSLRAAAAVINSPGQAMAAVWVVGFTPSMGADRMTGIAEETRRAAEEISRRIALQSFNGHEP